MCVEYLRVHSIAKPGLKGFVPQSHGIGNDGHRAEAHGCCCYHGRHDNPEERVEYPCCNGHTQDIIEKRKEEILFDIAHGGLAQEPRPGNGP